MNGYIKTWNIGKIKDQLLSATYVCTDPRQDGFTTWPIKQELYELRWFLDDLLKQCPTYADESQWLHEREQQRIIEILKTE